MSTETTANTASNVANPANTEQKPEAAKPKKQALPKVNNDVPAIIKTLSNAIIIAMNKQKERFPADHFRLTTEEPKTEIDKAKKPPISGADRSGRIFINALALCFVKSAGNDTDFHKRVVANVSNPECFPKIIRKANKDAAPAQTMRSEMLDLPREPLEILSDHITRLFRSNVTCDSAKRNDMSEVLTLFFVLLSNSVAADAYYGTSSFNVHAIQRFMVSRGFDIDEIAIIGADMQEPLADPGLKAVPAAKPKKPKAAAAPASPDANTEIKPESAVDKVIG